jgi:hypothetical protein
MITLSYKDWHLGASRADCVDAYSRVMRRAPAGDLIVRFAPETGLSGLFWSCLALSCLVSSL